MATQMEEPIQAIQEQKAIKVTEWLPSGQSRSPLARLVGCHLKSQRIQCKWKPIVMQLG